MKTSTGVMGYAGRDPYPDRAFRASRGAGLSGCGCTDAGLSTLAALPPQEDGMGQVGAIVAGALQVGSQVVGLFTDTPAEKAAAAQQRMMEYKAAFERLDLRVQTISKEIERGLTLDQAERYLETNARDEVLIRRADFLADLQEIGVPEAQLYADLAAEELRQNILDASSVQVFSQYWPFALLGVGVLGFGAWKAWQYFTD